MAKKEKVEKPEKEKKGKISNEGYENINGEEFKHKKDIIDFAKISGNKFLGRDVLGEPTKTRQRIAKVLAVIEPIVAVSLVLSMVSVNPILAFPLAIPCVFGGVDIYQMATKQPPFFGTLFAVVGCAIANTLLIPVRLIAKPFAKAKAKKLGIDYKKRMASPYEQAVANISGGFRLDNVKGMADKQKEVEQPKKVKKSNKKAIAQEQGKE